MEPPHIAKLRGLASGRSGVALALWGEPGIGKSHLARRILEALPFPGYALEAGLPPSHWLRWLPPAQLPP
jgi:MoxR-like ATPase